MKRVQTSTGVWNPVNPAWWLVPPHLQGLTCVCCQRPFRDGDTHGEMQPDWSLRCQTRRNVPEPLLVWADDGGPC